MGLTTGQQERFDRWYRFYPVKKGKGQALKAWEKIDPDDALTERMIAAIENQKRERAWKETIRDRFIAPWKYPATWLSAMCWEDECDPGPQREVIATEPEPDFKYINGKLYRRRGSVRANQGGAGGTEGSGPQERT